ncbi:delta-12 fatty acid desaturase protein [Irpex rosettiformis]|uniref:Delta-12 fatty acid desaturase protein n=1 Tax=Irpex rosettiformis TaxID=378272 RepID=A0ACB8U2N3_9APHY|nr:delta-12 fatty acid desaturase protein [Irpex rosettiformis]
MQVFSDSPEYVERTKKPFVPPELDYVALRKALPEDIWRRSTTKSLIVFGRLIVISSLLHWFGLWLVRGAVLPAGFPYATHPFTPTAVKIAGWAFYLWWQPIAWAGFWALGHDADHGNVSQIYWVNHLIGFLCHSWVFLPYFSWRITHLRHHKHNGSLEMDEAFVPYTRSDLRLPPKQECTKEIYKEAIEDSPLFSLWRLFVMQFFGHQTYLIWNTMGSKRFPEGSNHYTPINPLFEPHQKWDVIMSDVGIGGMFVFLAVCIQMSSFSMVWKLFILPWFITNHWIVTMAILQHTDPTVPHYREGLWTKARGALVTIDRTNSSAQPFLGWIGEWFLIGINHNHVAHHLFAQIPFHNLWKASEILRPMLGPAYTYDSTNVFRALWRSFTECVFVEDEGDIVFYKNMQAESLREARFTEESEVSSDSDSSS